MRAARRIISRLLIVLASVSVTLIMLEIAVRLFAPVTDYPLQQFYPGVGTRYRPNQIGTRRFGADGKIGGRYYINGQGWNSAHEYETPKADDTLRIALIGDSFVDGLQVDFDRRADAVIEEQLKGDITCDYFGEIQVYNFGMSGSPLSQYLNVLRYVSTNYPADVYIINVVFNDIDQSWASVGRSDFMTFRVNSQNEFEEVAPKSWVSGWLRPIANQSALFRYFYFNLQAAQALSNRQDPRTDNQDDPADIAEQLDQIESQATPDLIETILERMRGVTSRQHAELLLTLDGDRTAIYTGTPQEAYSFKHAPIVREKADLLEIPYIDLAEVFAADFQQNHQRFEFPTDYHWNERGHKVMGDAVAAWISRNICRPATP